MRTKNSLLFFSLLLVAAAEQTYAQNTWTQKANLTGIQRATLVAFTIDSVAYAGLGYNFSQSPIQQTDLWKYSPATDTWTQMSSLPAPGVSAASAFAIGSKGYVAGGFSAVGFVVNDIWEYDAVLNSWMQKTSCPCAGRDYAVAFSINGKGYLGTGYDASSNNFNDFWEYNPVTDSWLQKADVPGLPRSSAVGFSIGNKGYVGAGYIAGAVNDFWQFDPQSNTWTQKANIGTQGISDACGFALAGEGYICTGYINSAACGDMLEYDTLTDTWTPMLTLTGPARSNSVGFAIGNKGYVTCGNDNSFSPLSDLWEYTTNNIPTTISFEKYSANAVSVFPSLAYDRVKIHSSVQFRDAWLTIVNITGQVVSEKAFTNDVWLDVSLWKSGLYFVRIKSAGLSYESKFIKE